MKLDEQCMKDILKYLVEKITITDNGVYCGCKIVEIQKHFEPQYSTKETAYAINKLFELKYINMELHGKSWNDNHSIDDVTYAGHKYLES